jgi:hypothetical protein
MVPQERLGLIKEGLEVVEALGRWKDSECNGINPMATLWEWLCKT